MSADPLADFLPDPDGLRAATDVVARRRAAAGQAYVAAPVLDGVPDDWPADGWGGEAALDALEAAAFDGATRIDHPGFLAHMDPPTPWFTWAAVQWAASTNQNLLHPDVAPSMRALERRVVDWLAPEFGMAGGHLVPGSTLANVTALWAARNLTGARTVVASEAAHLSIRKATDLLGLELVEAPADPTGAVDPERMPSTDGAIVVLTAGTVTCGAVDPLDLASDAAWRHVDAAWAGPLRLTGRGAVLDGVERADSVGFSAHKWLHQPKESAVVLFADPERVEEAIGFGGTYLSAPDIGVLGSTGARALPLAVTMLAWGRSGIARVVEAGMNRIDELEALLRADERAEVFASNRTGVLGWRPVGVDDDEMQGRRAGLDDVWVSTAVLDGRTWFRSVGANPMADPARVVEAVLGAG